MVFVKCVMSEIFVHVFLVGIICEYGDQCVENLQLWQVGRVDLEGLRVTCSGSFIYEISL
jgi:hypothetical protein